MSAKQLFFVRFQFTDHAGDESFFMTVEVNSCVIDERVVAKAAGIAGELCHGRARVVEIKHAGRLLEM